jgi:hypothetical protein
MQFFSLGSFQRLGFHCFIGHGAENLRSLSGQTPVPRRSEALLIFFPGLNYLI